MEVTHEVQPADVVLNLSQLSNAALIQPLRPLPIFHRLSGREAVVQKALKNQADAAAKQVQIQAQKDAEKDAKRVAAEAKKQRAAAKKAATQLKKDQATAVLGADRQAASPSISTSGCSGLGAPPLPPTMHAPGYLPWNGVLPSRDPRLMAMSQGPVSTRSSQPFDHVQSLASSSGGPAGSLLPEASMGTTSGATPSPGWTMYPAAQQGATFRYPYIYPQFPNSSKQ